MHILFWNDIIERYRVLPGQIKSIDIRRLQKSPLEVELVCENAEVPYGIHARNKLSVKLDKPSTCIIS